MTVIFRNKVEEFFARIAEFEGIDLNHKWKALLVQRIGKKIGANKSDSISTWINRNKIPKHAIQKILNLNIPNDLKEFCKNCSELKNIGFTLEAHCLKGNELRAIYNYFINLQIELSKAYSFTLSDKVRPIIDSILELKNKLDSKVFEENPNEPTQRLVQIYYGAKKLDEAEPNYVSGTDSLLKMTKEIIDEGGEYAESLSANIKSFYRSVENEKRMNSLEKRLSDLERSKTADRRKSQRRITSKTPELDRRSGEDRRKFYKTQ